MHDSPMRKSARITLALLGIALLLVLLVIPAERLNAQASQEPPEGFIPLRMETEMQGSLVIMEDKEQQLTLQQAADPGKDAEYIPYLTSGLASTMSESAYWVRLPLYNDRTEQREILLELSKPQLSHVTLYVLDQNRRLLSELTTGSSLPFYERNVNHRNFLFKVTLPAEQGRYLYLRVQTDTYLQLPVKLWEEGSFLHKEQMANFAFGIYYGIMVGMALYNLFLFITIRDKAYLFYVLFILSFALMQAVWDGLAYQFLWPGSPDWELKANPVFIILTGLFACAFSKSFLSVSAYSRIMSRIINGFMILTALMLPLFVILTPAQCTKLAVNCVLASLLLCLSMIGVVRFRIRSVIFYCFAWFLLFAGGSLNLLAAYKVLPLNFLTLYGVRFGSAGETLLLSVALADRFNRIRQEKVAEQKQGILLKKLHVMTQNLTSTHDLDSLLIYTLDSLSQITNCENGVILIHNQDDSAVTVKAAIGNGLPEGYSPQAGLEHPVLSGFLEEKHPVFYFGKGSIPPFVGEGIVSCISLPLFYRERHLGLILLYSSQTIRLSDNERDILSSFAGQVGISIENARLFSEINRMAQTDGLTGIYNRTHFLQLAEVRLAEARLNGCPLSLVMADIDHFKRINDRYGHLAGDHVIIHTTRMLSQLIKPTGMIGRYGGEEFIMLLPGIPGDQALLLAEKMRESISDVLISAGGDTAIHCTLSLGVSSLDAETASLTELIEMADQGLYRAKETGRNRTSVFNGQTQASIG